MCGDGNGQVESQPVATCETRMRLTSAEQGPGKAPQDTTSASDAASPHSIAALVHLPRVPARCIKQLNYGTLAEPGRCAVEVGECEVAYGHSGTIWVYQHEKLQYTFHPSQHEKFDQHFQL